MRTLRPPDHERKEPYYKVIVNIFFLRELVHSLYPMLYTVANGRGWLESGPFIHCQGSNCTLMHCTIVDWIMVMFNHTY